MTSTSIERIQVILEGIIRPFQSSINRANTQLQGLGKNLSDAGKVMTMSNEQLGGLNKRFSVMKTTGGRAARSFRTMTHGLRGFRMEMLGTMFFGQMLQRTFMGFLQPALAAQGAFDIIKLTLLDLFTPITSILMPALFALTDWFMNLPEGVKTAIGVLVLFGAALGFVLSMVGMLALGLGSVIQLFGAEGAFAGTGKVISGILTTISGAMLTVIGIFVALGVVIAGIVLAVKDNFLNIKKFIGQAIDGIKGIFQGLFNIVSGIFEALVAIVSGDFEGLKTAVKKVVEGIKGFFAGVRDFVIGMGTTIIIGILKIIQNVINLIVDGVKWMVGKLVGLLPDWLKDLLGIGGDVGVPGLTGLSAGGSTTQVNNIVINNTGSNSPGSSFLQGTTVSQLIYEKTRSQLL